MCEVFNSKLVDGRDKPIITLLEYIREYLMRKIVNVLKVIEKSSGLLTPYAANIMKSVTKEANRLVLTIYFFLKLNTLLIYNTKIGTMFNGMVRNTIK